MGRGRAERRGHIDTGTGVVAGKYTAASRFGDGKGTNPEELLGAAHAACFSMALTLILGEAGHEPESVETEAKVYLRRTDTGFEIHKIDLETVGTVPGISEDEFRKHAEVAKAVCPVSKALAGAGDHPRGEACRLTGSVNGDWAEQLSARDDPADPVGRQRRLRARQQRRVLRVLRHGDQPLADRRGRAGHPRRAT